MGIIRRIADWLDPVEQRAADPSWAHLQGFNTATGHLVDHRTAEGLSVVASCVSAISSAIGSLPAWVYRRTGDGREILDGHALALLIQRGPNRSQTWSDFVEWLVASTLLRGNGLAEIVSDGEGRVIELLPIPWENVSIQLLRSGRLVYDVTEIVSIAGSAGRPRRLLDTEVIHLRDRTDDGLIGKSRLSRAAATLGPALSLQGFQGAMWRNGVHPSGAIMMEGKIGQEAREGLRKEFAQMHAGPENAARTLILDQGLKWESISVTPEDAELLASRRFAGEELARLYNVPPPLVGIWDHSSFTNSETAGRWFAQFTLSPWLRKIEGVLGRTVLGGREEIELDLSAFLRGDPEQRWRSYDIAVNRGILSRDEIREIEGFNPGAPEPPAPEPAPQQ